MIFNPYQLTPMDEATAAAAAKLQQALPLLQDNIFVVCLILIFLASDILACSQKGVMRYQLQWIVDTRNARTFESTIVVYPWLKGILLIQIFVSFGLALYAITDEAPGLHLLHPDTAALVQIGLCTGALLGWFMLQLSIVNWLCYLFDIEEKKSIMNRSYRAAFMLLAPFATLCLVCLISGLITPEWALNLLAALFILSQISFIFSGIKIFFNGIGSICLIFVYLCALEIGPLLMLWTRFG